MIAVSGERSRIITPDDLEAAQPEVIAIACCGYSTSRTLEDIPIVASQSWWHRLDAVKKGNVFVMDGNAFLVDPVRDSSNRSNFSPTQLTREFIRHLVPPIRRPGLFEQTLQHSMVRRVRRPPLFPHDKQNLFSIDDRKLNSTLLFCRINKSCQKTNECQRFLAERR